jgi:ubiquitin carboxyl-terminal hydrolase 22/27/51
MSVIIQTFLHNPILRAHYLSDRHNHRTCVISRASKEKIPSCLGCEMDKMFAEVRCYMPPISVQGPQPLFAQQCYSLDQAGIPVGPTTFLAATWASSKELAGYAQQDAHEFFISGAWVILLSFAVLGPRMAESAR